MIFVVFAYQQYTNWMQMYLMWNNLFAMVEC